MENPLMAGKSLSCRGVSFEDGTQSSTLFTVSPLNEEEIQGGRWVWLPWNSSGSFRNFSSKIQGSMSRHSSHFCDLDIDEEGESEVEEKDIEKQESSQNLQREHPPITIKEQAKPKRKRLSVILFDQGLFTVYKRLFLLSVAINFAGIALAINGNFSYGKKKATLFSIGNILALTLCRSEAFLRLLFFLTVKLLGHSWIPVFPKIAATSFLQCLGGIHSGCGVSSVGWLVYAVILTLQNKEETTIEIIVIAYIILILLCFSCLAAFPVIRHLHHNVFERTHRFAGWTALILLWLFVFLTLAYDPITKSYKIHSKSIIFHSQEFWFTLSITLLIILPWITVRRVPVTIMAPSNHASIIKFGGGISPGILGRISRSPLSEWHAFGIISDGETGHMMIAGAVGDFTRKLISDPPKHLWVRSIHFAGLPYLVNLYNRVLLVATGSGIAVFLSFLLQPSKTDVCVLWITKGVEQNFGKEMMMMLNKCPQEKIIVYDTALLDRPNVAELSVETAKRWQAEVVVVTSNPEGSRDVVHACNSAGIHAFGPIWDS